MTVKELREHLAHYDENMPVFVEDTDWGDWGNPKFVRHTDLEDKEVLVLVPD